MKLLYRALSESVARIADRRRRFAVGGGDHGCAIGTWSGAAHAYGRIGLVWIDAHMDSHTTETTPTGNLHGMPLACLLGFGDPRLTGLAPRSRAIDPANVCLVGVRSYEAEEADLQARLGVRVITMDEIKRRGLADSIDEATTIARRGTAAFGVSLDVDALDSTFVPGVAVPVTGGLRPDDVLDRLDEMARQLACRGLALVEYNPALDPKRRHAPVRRKRTGDVSSRLTIHEKNLTDFPKTKMAAVGADSPGGRCREMAG